MQKPAYNIGVAIVQRDDKWLVAQRPHATHLGGFWEFPGGKIRPRESPTAAALRELAEECGVEAEVVRALEPISHEYEDRIVRISAVVCRWRSGEPRALAANACQWVSDAELTALEMPAANVHIVRNLLAAGGSDERPVAGR